MDNDLVARATAFIAGNGYAIVRIMDIIDARPELPKGAAFLILIPAFGLGCAIDMLDTPTSRFNERLSGLCLFVVGGIWLAWRFGIFRF